MGLLELGLWGSFILEFLLMLQLEDLPVAQTCFQSPLSKHLQGFR